MLLTVAGNGNAVAKKRSSVGGERERWNTVERWTRNSGESMAGVFGAQGR